MEEEAQLRQRVAWLEAEVARAYSIDVSSVQNLATGSAVPSQARESLAPVRHQSPQQDDYGFSQGGQSSSPPEPTGAVAKRDSLDQEIADIAADVAFLSLNATGEMRFMGGASGVLFSKLIACTVKEHLYESVPGTVGSASLPLTAPSLQAHTFAPVPRSEQSETPILPLGVARELLDVYLRWVHTQYPIFHRPALCHLVEAVCGSASEASPFKKVLFYLVMALGAWHHQNFAHDSPYSATELFGHAMENFDDVQPLDGIGGLHIVLLLAVYASYRPTGSSQWHLLGIAMRVRVLRH